MEEDRVSLLMEDWAVNVDVLDKDLQKAQWNKPSIYKLPATTTGGSNDNNKKSAAYFPHTVSFGPYHHDKGDHLKKMDPHKRRVLGHFLQRYKITLQKLVDSLTTTNYRWQQVDHTDNVSDPKELPIDIQKEVLPVLQHLMDAYDSLDDKWLHDHDGFLKLMILDGCFMLEILQWSSVNDEHKALESGSISEATASVVRRNKRKTTASALTGSVDDYCYADNDPIFSLHGKLYFMSYIRRDMLMLENQLPMLLLKTLLGAALPTEPKEAIEKHLNTIILNFCGGNSEYENQNMSPCLHVLDLNRKSLLQSKNLPERLCKTKNCSKVKDRTFIFGHRKCTAQKNRTAAQRSVTNLHESGIKFEESTSNFHPTEIWVEGHTLKLPVVDIDDTIESKLLNLMAFERIHVGVGNDITSYVYFMDSIIDSADDVKILRTSGVLINSIGSDKAVAKLFNELSKDVTPDPENMLEKIVLKELDDHCKNQWNEWRATLSHTYFKSPWAFLSLLAAVLLLALTISQTFYAIYGYYKPRK
ncbi:hypothetical protein C5167_027762 [Papaver somniferum]|uniref:UPF0481 protein At3g47200-like n=1 Tax=Papaver somniferum TaxID=3469 RepID=UPI000E70442E|nr:UPF0481 protein At3g47200-like [Papaver somniferum]RZC91707.1 hypothetical protein C5167_027762 [Papaver somniferum]